MNALPELVREGLADLAETAAVPDGIADRALAAGAAQRRRRTVLVAAAAVVAAAALATPYAVLRPGPPAPAAGSAPPNAVFALHRGGTEHPDRTEPDPEWEILDPGTGQYRRVVAGRVSAPAADLRYAAVTALFTDADTRRIGRYDTASGEIRWHPAPAPAVAVPQISPDGRHAAYWLNDSEGQEGAAVVNLETGAVARIPITRWALESGDPRVGDLWLYPPRDHEMLLTNDRVILHDTAYDLSGERLGTVALPGSANLIALRPDGTGGLVKPGGEADTYALFDGDGTLGERVEVPGSCLDAGKPGDCPASEMGFLGWRGENEMLFWTGPGRYDRAETLIDAVDLRTGERRTVHRIGGSPSVDAIVPMAADRLSPEVRERVAF